MKQCLNLNPRPVAGVLPQSIKPTQSAVLGKQQGFTLVELIITLVVAGILVSIGLPNFTEFIRTNRVSNASQQWQTAMMTARTASLSRSTRVSIAAIAVGSATEDWNNGWQVFVDDNNNGIADAGETVLLRQEAWATVTSTSDYFFFTDAAVPTGRTLGVPSYVNGRPLGLDGALGNYAFTVALTDLATGGSSASTPSAKHWWLNCVAVTGRVRLVKYGDAGATSSTSCTGIN